MPIPIYHEVANSKDADIHFREDVKGPSKPEAAPTTDFGGGSCKSAANGGPASPNKCYQFRQQLKFTGNDHPHDVIGPITIRRSTIRDGVKVYSWSSLVHELGHLLFAMGHEYVLDDGDPKPLCMRSFMENSYYLNACTTHDHLFENRASSYQAELFESWPEFDPARQQDKHPGGSVWDWMFFMGFTHQIPANSGSMPDPYNFLDFDNNTIGKVNWL